MEKKLIDWSKPLESANPSYTFCRVLGSLSKKRYEKDGTNVCVIQDHKDMDEYIVVVDNYGTYFGTPYVRNKIETITSYFATLLNKPSKTIYNTGIYSSKESLLTVLSHRNKDVCILKIHEFKEEV
jgi:putative hemolysin